MKVIQETDVSDEGYSRNVTYLMKVIPVQKREVFDEGYSSPET
jgi:hypothetical protein